MANHNRITERPLQYTRTTLTYLLFH